MPDRRTNRPKPIGHQSWTAALHPGTAGKGSSPASGTSQFMFKPCEVIGFGGIHGPKPYEFIGFGAIHGPKPFEFIGLVVSTAPRAAQTPKMADFRSLTN